MLLGPYPKPEWSLRLLLRVAALLLILVSGSDNVLHPRFLLEPVANASEAEAQSETDSESEVSTALEDYCRIRRDGLSILRSTILPNPSIKLGLLHMDSSLISQPIRIAPRQGSTEHEHHRQLARQLARPDQEPQQHLLAC